MRIPLTAASINTPRSHIRAVSDRRDQRASQTMLPAINVFPTNSSPTSIRIANARAFGITDPVRKLR